MTKAFDQAFNDFIGTLYTNGTLPPVLPIPYIMNDDVAGYYKSTGNIPVLTEDEEAACPVFGDWGVHYAFYGWVAYRGMTNGGNDFSSMAADVLNNVEWSPETAEWISIISALVDVQNEYAEKFGHHPVDLNKFIKSYIRYGASTVLRGDVY
jgi:hypothetical protein